MKVKIFHQFIIWEKGPVNTAIIDFLKGDVYQINNELLEKFLNREYNKIEEILEEILNIFEEEELIIEVEEGTWIPQVEIQNDEANFENIELEVEEGINLRVLGSIVEDIGTRKIVYYGRNTPPELDGVEVEKRERDFEKCKRINHITGKFEKVDENYYSFNKLFNSCWGKKIAITKEGVIKPCIYSKIEIARVENGKLPNGLVKKMDFYWKLTKDKIEKCKDCELRYVCYDCREIPLRETGNLFSPSPYCAYDPYTGKWKE